MKRARLKLWIHRGLTFLGLSIIGLFVFSLIWVAFYSKYEVNHTPQMVFYQFETENDSVKMQVEHEWIPIDSISRNLIVAVLASQDKDFYVHDGFSLIDERDSSTTARFPEVDKTISQKTAHVVFLSEGKVFFERPLENYFTILTEYMWGKDRILEVYLNSVLIGDGIFGVEAASRIYFGKGSGEVTRQEAAFIAAMIDMSKTANFMAPDSTLLNKQRLILARMALMTHIKIGKKPIDEKDVQPSRPVYRRSWRG